GNQEEHQLGALVAVARVAQWNKTLDVLFPAFAAAEVVEAKGVDQAGTYRVDADAVGREVERHRAAECVDGGLGGGVGGGLGRRDFARDRRNVDDAAAVALSDHFSSRGARQQKRPIDIGHHHFLPDFVRKLDGRDAIVAAGGAGVVD